MRGNVEISGDISVELAPQHGRLLRHALGVLNSGTPDTYEYTIGTAPPGLTIEKQFPDIAGGYNYFQYTGCKVNSLKMTFKSEGPIDCSFSFMGADETIAETSADADPTDAGHDPFDAFNAVITDKDDASIGSVTELDFTLENNLDGNTYVIDGTGKRKALPAGIAKVSGTLKALFENITLYNLAVNNTETSIKVTLTKGTGAGTDGNEKLTIEMQEIKYAQSAPVISGPQGVMVELPFEAYYDNGANASAMKMTLLAASAFC
jgi:hypothetical protein